MSGTTRALVLGGGGVAGVAWETGVLAGLADAGVDVTGADRIVGTSAGSVVGAQITSGLPLEELLRRQTEPALQSEELTPGVPMDGWLEQYAAVYEQAADAADRRRLFGALALRTPTGDEADRIAVIRSRLPVQEWPDRDLVIVAVEAHTGEPEFFGPRSGVSLVDAVAASCAVPGVWPPVTIRGTRWVDGGVRSIENADLAEGHDRVLVLAPMADPELDDRVRALSGRAEVIAPDEASLAAMGANPLDPAVRRPCAEAGRAQGMACAARVADLWR